MSHENQHFDPKHYLRRFSPDKEHVFTYEKGSTNFPQKTPISETASRSFYYVYDDNLISFASNAASNTSYLKWNTKDYA